MASYTTSTIDISYSTSDYDVSFNLNFGEGLDSIIEADEKKRKNYTNSYNIEVFEFGEEDNKQKGYRVVGNEAPVVINVSNISINSINRNDCEYALGFAVDNLEPYYNSENETLPNNIERDGTMWTIPANDRTSYKFDQNPKAKYQWNIKYAADIGYEPTEEEKELGFEKTSEKTGLIYVTFMVFKKDKPNYEPSKSITRGVTRGVTRGATRGGDSSAARFGYGNEASSSSKKSDFEYAKNTEKFILPIRFRINNNSKKNNINCSKTLVGANVNVLKRKTVVVPF